MKNAVKDTKALVVTAQDSMLEKLLHSEVSLSICPAAFNSSPVSGFCVCV